MKKMHEHAVEALHPWQGGRAQSWSFTASHGRLEIRLTKPGPPDQRKGNLHLVCEDCRRVMFKGVWGSVQITVEHMPEHPETRFVVCDDDNLYVECNAVMTLENVEPIHDPS
jgi:hypothetical protein